MVNSEGRHSAGSVWAVVVALLVASAGCRHARPEALPHPVPIEAWRAGAELVGTVPPVEPPVEVMVEPERPPFDLQTVDPKLRQKISLHAENTSIQQIVLTLAKQAGVNVTVDPDVVGQTSAQFTDTPLITAIDQVVRQYGFAVSVDGAFLRVYRPALESRLYRLNFPASSRRGEQRVTVSDRVIAASAPLPGASGAGATPQGGDEGSSTSISSTVTLDIWRDVTAGLRALVLSPEMQQQGGAQDANALQGFADKDGRVLVINPAAGTVQVKADPKTQQAVRDFLMSVQTSLQRQVVIEARVLEVSLSDEFRFGINLSYALGIDGAGATLAQTSVNAGSPANFTTAVVSGDASLSVFLAALSKAGRVDVVSSPHIAVTNNQKAVVKVVKERVFFLAQVQPTVVPSGGAALSGGKQFVPLVVNEGIVLDVTPQIGADGWVTMNIHPSFAEVVGTVKTPNTGSGEGADGELPEMSRREMATVVRVLSGSTVMIGGLMSEKTEIHEEGVPFLKDLWLLGHLFRSTRRETRRSELVLLLTPRVVGLTPHVERTREMIDRLKNPTELRPLPEEKENEKEEEAKP